MAEKKYIKTYCPNSKCYGLVTAEMNNGAWAITNFYEIDDETAKKIQTEHGGALPPVSSHLKACASCGSRTPSCCDKKRQCNVPKHQLWYQCLYCNSLTVCAPEGGDSAADIYFLMDQSGSMSDGDRREAAEAVRRMIQSLSGRGNSYSFVAFGSTAGYLFKNEANPSKISSALSMYQSGNTPYTGGTAVHLAIHHIIDDVRRSSRPVRVILVTDGYFDSDSSAVSERNALLRTKNNIEILAIGITGANDNALAAIGTVKKFSRVCGTSSALSSTFEDIARTLKAGGNNF